MIRRRASRLPLLLVAFLCLAVQARAQEGLPIRAIEIQTSPGLEALRVRDRLRLRVGDFYRDEDRRADILRLWELGHVREADIRPYPLDDGVKLVVAVRAWPLVNAVEFTGDLGLAETNLRALLGAKPGESADGSALAADRAALESKLRESGYAFAAVTQTTREAENGVAVAYQIQAGPRVRVEAISFEGNDSFAAADLRRVLSRVTPGNVFSRGQYDPAGFARDLEQVAQHYRDRGWLDVEVGHRLEYDAAREHLYPVVRVREGARYAVVEIRLDIVPLPGAEPAISREELLSQLRVQTGAFYSQADVDADIAAIKNRYGAIGRIWTQAAAERLYTAQGPRVILSFHVVEGREIYIERVDIRGNTLTHDHVIRRDVSLIPGQRADSQELEISRWRLINTGIFSAPPPAAPEAGVNISFVPGSSDNTAVVIVDVTEGAKGSLALGFGLGTVEGFTGLFDITHNNFDIADWPKSLRDLTSANAFAGDGQTLSLRLTPGASYHDYRLSWLQPSLRDSAYSLGLEGFAYAFEATEYTDSRNGASFSLGRRLTPYLSLKLVPSYERANIKDVSADAAPDILGAAGLHYRHALGAFLEYDNRDNRFFPSRGHAINGGVTVVGTGLGGNVNAVKESIEARWHYTLFDAPGWGKHIIHLGGEIAAVQATRGGDVPFFERYFAGGENLRGFDYRGIGPVDSATGDHIGGNTLLLARVEYDMPVPRANNVVRIAAFCDAGKVGERSSDFSPGNFSAAVGLGLRLRVLQGPSGVPISFDLGFPIVKQSNDKKNLFTFSMGTALGF